MNPCGDFRTSYAADMTIFPTRNSRLALWAGLLLLCCAPLLLGRGVVVFTTSLMYTRFADIGNYPSGAAIGVSMLVLAFAVVYGLSALARRLLPG